mgnify:CR=1 FL=1
MEMEFEKFLHLLFFCEILLLQNKRNVAHQIKNTNNNQNVTLNQKKCDLSHLVTLMCHTEAHLGGTFILKTDSF